MATNKVHFAATVLFPHVYEVEQKENFSEEAAAKVIMNDSMRCWVGPRELSHFTINPETGKVSWIAFPNTDVKKWTEDTFKDIMEVGLYFSAGKPEGKAVVDEATIPAEFWEHNDFTLQNKFFYLHLIQDKSYDRFIRSIIDVSKRYEDKYVFDGKVYTGAQIRGEGMERWSKGLLSELDDQFFVRIAKRYYKATEKDLDEVWITNHMKYAIHETYSPELAVKTIRFVNLSEKANNIIQKHDFDAEVWPVPNHIVDQYVDYMLEDMLDACQTIELL